MGDVGWDAKCGDTGDVWPVEEAVMVPVTGETMGVEKLELFSGGERY